MDQYKRYERIPFEDTALPIRINFGMSLNSDCIFRKDGFSWHEQIELLYFWRGEATVFCGNRSFDVGTGDVVIINPYEVHQLIYKSGSPQYDCLMLDDSLFSSSVRADGENRYLSLLTDSYVCFENCISGDEALVGHIQALCREIKNKEPVYELAVKSHAFGLFVNLFRYHVYSQSAFRQLVENIERYDRIKPAVTLMKSNLKEQISLEDLAAACHLSASHFCRLFHQITGCSPIRYLLDIRLQEAATQLKRTNKSITQIAYDVGFEDIGYFSRKFKEKFEMSPTQAKKRYEN